MFLAWGFLVGIFAVWLYAAIRPRYGAGPKTALCAGAAVWGLGYHEGTHPRVPTRPVTQHRLPASFDPVFFARNAPLSSAFSRCRRCIWVAGDRDVLPARETRFDPI